MALISTGLGWSADENFLMQSGNSLLGSIKETSGSGGGAQFPNQPIPQMPTTTPTFGTGGFFLYENSPLQNYIESYPGADVYVFLYQSGSNIRTVYASLTSTTVERYTYNRNRGTGSYTTENVNSKTQSTGDYYVYDAGFGNSSTYNSDIPMFSSREEGLAALSGTTTDCYKLNAGYAVACFVKWKSSPLTYNMSAILISSDSNFTVISENGSTRSSDYYSRTVSYSGIRFTVGLITKGDAEEATVEGNRVPYRDLTANIYRSIDELFAAIARLSSLTVTETQDPYSPIGPSGEDVGDGDFDDDDDEIPMSTLPSLSFASTGFCRVYSPTLSQLSALASYMWTDQTFLQTLANHIIQLLESPMESIISLSLVPCSPAVGPAESVKVLFIPIPDVSMYPVTNQFKDVECGTLDVNEYYGSALDYNPYTKISCFLPFIGMVELDTDEVMGKTLRITYRIDVVSGACTASIIADGDVLYQFSGHCSVQMPVTAADFTGYISALMSTAKLVAGLGASAAGAPVLGGAILHAPPIGSKSTSETVTETEPVVIQARNSETGRLVNAAKVTGGTEHRTTTHTPGGMNFGELAIRSSVNTVGAVMNSKAGVQHSGGFSGISGYLGIRYPYLIIKRPRLCNPTQYGQYNGRPSMIYASLGDCTGYTEVQSIHLTGIPATNPEMSEIAELLKSGVIL